MSKTQEHFTVKQTIQLTLSEIFVDRFELLIGTELFFMKEALGRGNCSC